MVVLAVHLRRQCLMLDLRLLLALEPELLVLLLRLLVSAQVLVIMLAERHLQHTPHMWWCTRHRKRPRRLWLE